MSNNNINFRLYLDESGNTGANMIDISQPYFTYGCWLIQDCQEDKLRDYIKKYILPKYKNDFNEDELKSTVYFSKKNTTNVYEEFYKLFCKILSFNSYPFVLLLEKKYIITSYMVEVFFNFKNPNNCLEFNEINNLKIDISNIVCNSIDEYSLKDFWDKIFTNQSISYNGLSNIKIKILEILKDNSLNTLHDYLNKSNNYNSQKVKTDKFIGNILSRILIRINEEMCANNKNIKVSVFHDKRSDFKNIKKHINKININKLNCINFPLNEKNSEDEVLIQLSDLLAGFFNYILNTKTIDEYAKRTVFEFFIKGNKNYGTISFMSYKNEYDFFDKFGMCIPQKTIDIAEIKKVLININYKKIIYKEM